MRLIADYMKSDAGTIAPDDTIQHAARTMDALNLTALPVCERGFLVAMLTEHDLAVRAVSAGRSPEGTRVDEVATRPPTCCFDNDPIESGLRKMAESGLHMIAVVDRAFRFVGTLSLSDIAHGPRALQKEPAAPTLAGGLGVFAAR
jgi:CBS domain-containing protein